VFKLKVFLLALLFINKVPVRAEVNGDDQRIVSFENRKLIGQSVAYLKDTTANLTIEDLVNSTTHQFTQSNTQTLNFGGSTVPYWIKFSYHFNESSSKYLEIRNTSLQEIDLYIVSNDSIIQHQSTGIKRRSSAAHKLSFWLLDLPNTKDNEVFTVYLRITDYRRLVLPLYITNLENLMTAHERSDFAFGIYFGLLLIVIITNIMVYIFFNERLYLIYVIHITVQILINGTLKGYLQEFLGPSMYWISSYIPLMAALSSLSSILFSMVFLEIDKKRNVLGTISLLICIVPIVIIVLNISQNFFLSSVLSTYSSLIICLWLFIVGIIVYTHRQVKQVRFFLLGWSFFFAGLFILNIALNGWIEVNEFTINAAIYGSTFEVLLLTLAMGDRVNILRREHEKERSQRIQLMEEQTTILERKVNERTAELAGKNNEIAAQNEELKQQHEELISINEVLDRQNKMVEVQKNKIETINQALEVKVQDRTNELEQTVKDLIRQNHDLEQFSYIVSHNMRSPIARMLGLLNLFESRDRKDLSYETQLHGYLRDSALGLDQIIQDLKQIIDMRKGFQTVLEKVDVKHIIGHVLTDLEEEIKNSNTSIITSIEIESITSIKSYLQSIFYNLISNALKYRSHDHRPHIEINIYQSEKTAIIKVKDNGLGIPLPEQRLSEIFNLYKRMHTHVEGKGLGLYLVKTQVQALAGSIAVTSSVNIGTTFTIMLPLDISNQ
jgi:signal transduction histidine kinase